MLMDNSHRLLLYILIHVIGYSTSIEWLGLHKWTANKIASLDHEPPTDSVKELLTRRQLRLLAKHPGLADIIFHTANSVVSDCQSTFNSSRWNCSSMGELPQISPELQTGTREQAYVYALASAHIAVQVATACSRDSLSMCRCSQPQYGDSRVEQDTTKLFQTSGCSVNLKVGLKISERFTDSAYKKYKRMVRRGEQLPHTKMANEAVMNMHNSKIGREEVKKAIVIKCKCHGMSGSCELKTCWNDLDTGKLNNDLLHMYRSARAAIKVSEMSAEVDISSPHSKRETIQSSDHLLEVGGMMYDTTPDGFVFYSASSDYCNYDKRRGSHGTRGRRCGDEYKNSCDSMCCGRGYTQVIHTKINNRCNCKHVWCCHVECDVCKVDVTEYYCK